MIFIFEEANDIEANDIHTAFILTPCYLHN